MDPSLGLDINASEQKAMANLLRRVDKADADKQFWVKRLNMADLFGCCQRTVTNWLNALERAQLITKEQGRRDWGQFHCAVLKLTPYAVAMLGLDEPLRRTEPTPTRIPSENNQETVEQIAIRKKISPGIYETALYQSSSKRHPDELSTASQSIDGGFLKKNEGETVITSQGHSRVPADCQPLLALGVSQYGIYRLMREATLNKKRLGDIVTARLEALKGARKAYCLLRFLIQDPIDYAYQAQKTKDKSIEEKRIIEKEVIQEETKKKWAGRWLSPGDDGALGYRSEEIRIHVPSGDGWLPEIHVLADGRWERRGVLAGSVLLDFWAADGVWRGISLVDAPGKTATTPSDKTAAQNHLRLLRQRLGNWMSSATSGMGKEGSPGNTPMS